jgi:O-succinylbenzoate synthase
MKFKIYSYSLPIPHLSIHKQGFLIETENGWGEVAPLAGFSRESLNETLIQLKSIQEGCTPVLYPSVAFGLFPCSNVEISWPVSALLMGTANEIHKQAIKFRDYPYAKIKIGNLPLKDAIEIVKELKDHFRLRIDVNGAWSLTKALTFCSHFKENDFDYIEDPLQNEEELPLFPFPIAIDFSVTNTQVKARIWKPSLKGIPKADPKIILSSAYESGIGLARIVQLAYHLDLPLHPIGLGTYHYLEHDLLETPLHFSKGIVTLPKLKPNLKYVQKLA